MRNLRPVFFLFALALPLFAADTALDLMRAGRFVEAKQMIQKSNLSPRYDLLYYALTEADAARACSLYQVIAIRYPSSDCDSVARGRLDQARSMGFTVAPIAEWMFASADVVPLFGKRVVATPPLAPVVISPVVQSPAPLKVDSITAPETPKVAETKVEAISATVIAGVAAVDTPVATPVPIMSNQTAPATKTTVTQNHKTTALPELTAGKESIQTHDAQAVVSGGRWYIQVGAFSNEGNAHRLGTDLEKAGYTVKFVPRDGKARLLQVRVGGYATRSELPPVMAKLRDQFKVPTSIVAE